MILSDRGWQRAIMTGEARIEPLVRANIQPASVDLTLSGDFAWPDGTTTTLTEDDPELMLVPSDFVLASTAEWVEFGPELAGRVEGKSSMGRRGLLVHCTAGFIDPGFKGQITLELANVGTTPVRLRLGQKICQITALRLDQPAERPYGSDGLGSRYQGQTGATTARD